MNKHTISDLYQEQSEPQTEQHEPEKSAETPEFEDMEDGDEIIDLGDEKDQVLAEMKKSLAGDKETELKTMPGCDSENGMERKKGAEVHGICPESSCAFAIKAGLKRKGIKCLKKVIFTVIFVLIGFGAVIGFLYHKKKKRHDYLSCLD